MGHARPVLRPADCSFQLGSSIRTVSGRGLSSWVGYGVSVPLAYDEASARLDDTDRPLARVRLASAILGC